MTEPTDAARRSIDLRFEVDSNILVELGELLVAKRSVALAELVKNGYDADASLVQVRLQSITKPGGVIVVEDDGTGMTLEDIKTGWMRIGTTTKQAQITSLKYGRVRAGAKGIGRFAARRLSNVMKLNTVASGSGGGKERIEATINWKRFAKGQDVSQVLVEYNIQPVPDDTATGTKLLLEDVKDAWNKKDVEEVKRDLLNLTPPSIGKAVTTIRRRGKKLDPGFEIRIESYEFPEAAGVVSPEYPEVAWATLAGTVDKSGLCQFKLAIRNGRSSKFRIKKGFQSLGQAEYAVRIYYYDKEHIGAGDITLSDIRELGKTRGGVRVYLDDFRVFAYGEVGDDWLRLNLDKSRRLTATPEYLDKLVQARRPMLDLPGNNQLFGSVLLSRERNPSIHVTASRDRLIENQAFEELREFVRFGIDWATVVHARWKAEREERKRAEKLSIKTVLEVAKEKITKTISVLSPPVQKEILATFDDLVTKVAQIEEDHISELAMLRSLASTGTMIHIFEHEIGLLVGEFSSSIRALHSWMQYLPSPQRQIYRDTLAKLEKWRDSVESQFAFLGLMLGKKEREHRYPHALRVVVDEVASPFVRYMKDESVLFQNNVPAALRLPPMFGVEIRSILLNLLTNALKAVKKQARKTIRVDAHQEENRIVIHFLDSGSGLEESKWEDVFLPFVTYSEPDVLLGAGTGLGLSIVRSLVDENGGEVHFVRPPQEWSTCVEVILPKGES